jgi:TolA-binding protein
VSSQVSGDGAIDPTAERVADFVSAQIDASRPANAGEREFVRRLASFRQARRHRKLFAVGITIAATLGVGWTRFRVRREATVLPVLSYRVDNQEPPARGYILVSETAESRLAFSDGSSVTMAARTRGRVVELNGRGATVALDDGKVSVDIVPRPHARWIFEAGPFRINVHGTAFTAAWNPTEAVFEVRLLRGAVSVASPLAGPEIEMRAGQSLKASLRDQTVTMGTTSRVVSPPANDAAIAPAPPESPGETPPAPVESARWRHRGWMTALERNRIGDILAEADRCGHAAVLERADSDDLWAAANAARYGGRYLMAEQALSAHRRRFASSDRSREAAFLLGRLHEHDRLGPAEAIGWYDRFLAEAPEGVDVSDALGRKMTVLQRWNRRTGALAVARDYLRRFPGGTYAPAARALVQSSTAKP